MNLKTKVYFNNSFLNADKNKMHFTFNSELFLCLCHCLLHFDGLDFFAIPTGAQELLASELRNHSYFARGNI